MGVRLVRALLGQLRLGQEVAGAQFGADQPFAQRPVDALDFARPLAFRVPCCQCCQWRLALFRTL